MKFLQGHFNAIGATHYLCLGAIPLHIKFWGLDGAPPDYLTWSKAMGANALTCEGIFVDTALTDTVDLAFGEGVAPYEGGDLMTTTNQTDVTYGGGIYVKRDDKDYRYYTNAAAGIIGDASTETITTWTLGSAANHTGNFNGSVVGTYIGHGSQIRIQETGSPRRVYDAHIHTALAASGSAANAVTLDRAVPSGAITFIGGEFDYIPVPIGEITSPGMVINLTSTPFVDGEMVGFEAIMP